MNILVNAIDALEDSKKLDTEKTIRIETNLVQNKKWVQISISDNGDGIPEEIKSKIFDPFFTTKPIGKGTGMGMAISYQIIKEKHNGELYCFSQPMQGTRFVIEIPTIRIKSY